MQAVFLSLLNISITAGYLVLAILLLRPLLKKAPKFIRCILWGLVGIRLMLPFSIESIFSLIPSKETVPQGILYSSEPAIHSGIPAFNSLVNPILSESMAPTVGNSVNPMQVAAGIAANIWILGMVLLAAYALISYLRLRHKLREAVQEQAGIWVCDGLGSAFLLGLFRPRIYLPSSLNGTDKAYVIAHEKAHLSRRDHWWKPLGFLLLTVYWFNPLMWAAYIFLCRDIEYACDEKVIKAMGDECKKPYSEALIHCSVSRKAISACPVAFGEDGVKGRIRSILNYKKPAFWIILLAIIVCIAAAVCFLTVPKEQVQLFGHKYETGECLYSVVVSEDKESQSNPLVFDIHTNGEVYKEYEPGQRDYMGVLSAWPYTQEQLRDTLLAQKLIPASMEDIQKAYTLMDSSGKQEALFLLRENGDVNYICYFSTGEIMNIFALTQVNDCVQKSTSHTQTWEGYVTHINREGGYMLVNLTVPDSIVGYSSAKVPSCPDNIAEGSRVLIQCDGLLMATDSYPITLNKVYSVFPYMKYDYQFSGIVVEIREDAVAVEPAEGEDARNTAQLFVVRCAEPAGYKAGDSVTVYYDLLEELDPPIIPYPNTIARHPSSAELFSPDSSLLSGGQTVFDIDGDGITEYCCVTRHPFTGMSVLAVYAYENGVFDYFDYFIPGCSGDFSFLNNSDGTLSVISTDDDRVFSVSVQDSRLVLTDEDGQKLPYWGNAYEEVATLQAVIEKYPHFLNLPTFKGLEVYVWKNGDWRCGLRSGTNRLATAEEFFVFGGGASLEEMAVILSTYDIPPEHVILCYDYHPAFSGPYGLYPSAGEQAYIRATLLQYLYQPDWGAETQYPLVIYAFQMAPECWCFQFVEDSAVTDSPFDLMSLPHCNLEAAQKKLGDYDCTPDQIPVVVYQNPLSSYYGGVMTTDQVQHVRTLLGLS